MRWSEDVGLTAKSGMPNRKTGLKAEGEGEVNTWKVLWVHKRNLVRDKAFRVLSYAD